MSPRVLVAIPARWASGRFPGKPLADIAGKPLIQRSFEAASRLRDYLPCEIAIGTDDWRIADACTAFGAQAFLTLPARNGTERCHAVARLMPSADIVVNWQGDAPLLDAAWVAEMIHGLHNVQSHFKARTATLGVWGPLHRGSVTVPHESPPGGRFRRNYAGGEGYVHQGVYAYTRTALDHYVSLPATIEELDHGLEQLRWPDPWLIHRFAAPGYPLREVNYPEDVQAVADVIRARDAGS